MTRTYSESLALWGGLASAILIMLSPAAGLREDAEPTRIDAPGTAGGGTAPRGLSSPAPLPSAPAAADLSRPDQRAQAEPQAPIEGFACLPGSGGASAPPGAGFRATGLGAHGRWSFEVVRCLPTGGGPAHLVAVDPATGRKRLLDPTQDLARLDDALFDDLALIARHPERAAREAGTLVLRGPAGAACRIADSAGWDSGSVEDCRLTHLDADVARADCRSGAQPSWTYVFHLRSGDTLVFAAGEAGMAEDGRIVAGRFEFSGPHAPCPMTSASPDVFDGLVVVTPAGFDLRDLAEQPPDRSRPLDWVASDIVRYADRDGRTVCRRLQATTPQVVAVACP